MDFRSDFDGFPFKLGSFVRDEVTGIEGYAVVFAVPLSAAKRVSIEPKAAEGKNEPPKGIAVDVVRVQFISEGLSARVPEFAYDPNVDYVLGDAVKDILTDVKGHVVERYYFMSGCIMYSVVMKSVRDGGNQHDSVDQARLRKDTSVDSKVDKFVEKRTGGPTTYFSSAIG